MDCDCRVPPVCGSQPRVWERADGYEWKSWIFNDARVAELADALDSGKGSALFHSVPLRFIPLHPNTAGIDRTRISAPGTLFRERSAIGGKHKLNLRK